MPTNHRNEPVNDNHLNAIAFTASVVKSMPEYLNPKSYGQSIIAEAMTDDEMHSHFGWSSDKSPVTREHIVKNVKDYVYDMDSMFRDQYTHNTDIDRPRPQ